MQGERQVSFPVTTTRSSYETVRLFFVEILHLNSQTAEGEAAKLEANLDGETVYAMERVLSETDDWAELAVLVP